LLVRGGLFSSGQFLGYDAVKEAAKNSGIMCDGPILHVVGASCAAFLAVTFSTPADYIMNKYMSLRDLGGGDISVLNYVREECGYRGILSFYRGWLLFIIRVGPILCVVMPTYQQFRYLLGIGYLD